jgi:hypothetical protein
MPEPIVTSISLDTTKISAVTGKNIAHLSFKFDIPVQAYAIDTNGTSPVTGILAGHGEKNVANLKLLTVAQAKLLTVAQAKQYAADTIITDVIDSTELYAEGSNRVNIYGKSMDGTWSTYNQP